MSHDHKNLMLECPHGCMHDKFCIKFPNSHRCMCVMEIMWGIPFIPEPNQTLTYIMTSHSTSLEPKSQFIINLALGRKQKKRIRRRKGKFQSKSGRKQKKKKKKRKKVPDQRSEENRRNMQKGLWTRQYLNNTELSPPNKKRKETTT